MIGVAPGQFILNLRVLPAGSVERVAFEGHERSVADDLRITRLDRVFDTYDTEVEALAALGATRPSTSN